MRHYVVIKVCYWMGVAALLLAGVALTCVIRREHQYDTMIIQCSRARSLDPRLVAAIVSTASHFNPSYVGTQGGMGIMGIPEDIGVAWAVEQGRANFSKYDLFDPRLNIEVGSWWLARCMSTEQEGSDAAAACLAKYFKDNALAAEALKRYRGGD